MKHEQCNKTTPHLPHIYDTYINLEGRGRRQCYGIQENGMRWPKAHREETPPEGPMDEVIRWWLDKAHKEIQRTVPKALEYGGKGAALDLVDIGRELGRLLGRPNMAEGEAQELGIWFYLRGKISRWSAAIMEGRRVSEDTLFDIGVYVRMVQRIRDVGAWPESTAKSRGVVE